MRTFGKTPSSIDRDDTGGASIVRKTPPMRASDSPPPLKGMCPAHTVGNDAYLENSEEAQSLRDLLHRPVPFRINGLVNSQALIIEFIRTQFCATQYRRLTGDRLSDRSISTA
jgi:hypothetical protein